MHILAIGAHPDDIEYGCGGTLLRYARRGHGVYLYVATKGGLGGNAHVRWGEQEAAAARIGARDVFFGGYSDGGVPANRTLIDSIEGVIQRVQPDVIFVHYRDDTHQDHRALAEATVTATRYVHNVLFYEVPTTQNFSPHIYVDIQETLEDKIELLRSHASQVTKTNIADMTIVDLARSTANFRGIEGRVKYAEAFDSLRMFIEI